MARDYNIGFVKIDNLVWADADTKNSYEKIKNSIYPAIRRRELAYEIDSVKNIVKDALGKESKDITEVLMIGGMTNKSYKVRAGGEYYVIRIPGAATAEMIDRKNEKLNTSIASCSGYYPELLYFDSETGIKISKYVEDAETLTKRSIKKEENLKKVTLFLKELHTSSDFAMQKKFGIFEELEKYEKILKSYKGRFFKGYTEARKLLFKCRDRLKEIKTEECPCHNDLVSENIVKGKEGRIYLLDWEYSGINDPVWDLAALALENEFSEDDTELMFRLYYGKNMADENIRERFVIYQICQDMLWSVWTLVKENQGENFGTYGTDRFERAVKKLNMFFNERQMNDR